MRNLFSRLAKIEEEMQRSRYDPHIFQFSSGETLELTGQQLQKMYSDAMAREPNTNISFFLDQLEKGHSDTSGLVYWFAAYSKDPAELWADE